MRWSVKHRDIRARALEPRQRVGAGREGAGDLKAFVAEPVLEAERDDGLVLDDHRRPRAVRVGFGVSVLRLGSR